MLFKSATVNFICDTRFGKVKGSFSKINPAKFDFTNKIAKIEIETKTLSTGNSMRDNHLKNDEFFNVEKFPIATFEATSFTKESDNSFKLIGKLTIKDITKELNIPIKLKEEGNLKVFSGSVNVNRKDFKMEYDNFINPIEDKVILQISTTLEAK